MKILIFEKEKNLRNTGGPSGYIFNIKSYINKNNINNIYFLNNENFSLSLPSRFKQLIVYILLKVTNRFSKLNFVISVINTYFVKYRFSKKTVDYINSFDVVHVHSIPYIMRYFNGYRIKGTLVLTTHCPEPITNEIISNYCLCPFFEKHIRLKNYLIKKEVTSFDLCDYVMFPVPQAKEPYINSSPIYDKKFADIENKFFYVPTALSTIEPIFGNDGLTEKYTSSTPSIKICYVGRHTEIKGYDFLKEIAPKVWKTIPDAYFFIGGQEQPLRGLEDERWIELGWVNTARLLNEMDVFILPNKNTYFDIVMLEILRQGTFIITTDTGGNKWFKDWDIDGMRFVDYGDISAVIQILQEVLKIKKDNKLDFYKQSNRNFCREHFCMDTYMHNYLNLLSRIVK